MIAWLLAACGGPSPELVAASLGPTNEALAASLVVTELLEHVGAEPLRHEGCDTCPCVERTGNEAFYVLLMDYEDETGAGCTPTSGLVPAEVSGHVWLDVIAGRVATIRAEQSTLAGHTFDPRLDATWAPSGGGWEADIGCDFEVGSLRLDLGVQVERSAEGVVLDGLVRTPTAEVELERVELTPADVAGACPTPRAGRATVRSEGRVDVLFELGRVRVEQHGRSVDVELCAHTDGFLAPR